MADIRKLLQTIDSLSEATLPADHPDWNLPPAERIARQTARIASDSAADAEVWNKGLKAPVGDKKFVGDVHHQDEADDVEESTNFEDDSDKIYIGANVFANWDQFGHSMKVIAIVDDQRVKVQDDFGNVEVMFIKDLEAAESDYEPDEDVYPPTSDYAVTESGEQQFIAATSKGYVAYTGSKKEVEDYIKRNSGGADGKLHIKPMKKPNKKTTESDDSSLTEEIRAAFEDYVKNKATPADEKTRVTITYKDGHTQTKSVTEKERKRYETSDSVEKVEDAKGGKGRLDDTKLSEAPQSMKQALDNALSKVEPGSKMDKKIKHNNDMVRRFGKGTMTTAPSGYHIDKKGLVKLGEGAEQPTMPIDMMGKKCLRCKKDTYQEHSQHDDYQGTVTCSCRHSVLRWKKTGPSIDESIIEEALGDWILTVHDKFGNMIYTNYYNYREQADSAAAPYRKNGNEISITPSKNVSEGKSENRELWDKINSRGVVPSIDRERYTDLSHEGLEGPFRQKNGQVLYYDPRAGQYYNRDTDMYVDQDDFDAMNEGDEMNEAEAPVNAFGVTMDDEYYDKLHSKHNQAAWEEGQALKYQEEERKRRHAEGIPYVRERPQAEIDAWDRHVAKLRAKQGLGESEITELSDKTLSNYKDKAVASIIPTITQKGDIKKAAKHSRGSTLAQSKLDRLAKIRGTLEKLQDAVKEAKSKVGKKLEEAPIDQVVADANPDQAAALYRKNGNEVSITPGRNVSEGKSENRELWDKINSRGVQPPIDRERYTDLSHEGLEGPFRMKTGLVLYYDPKEGKYYNRDTDMYISNEEMDEINRYGLAEDEDDSASYEYDTAKLVQFALMYSPKSHAGNEVKRFLDDPESLPYLVDDVIQLIDEAYYESIDNGPDGPSLPEEKEDLQFFRRAVKKCKLARMNEDRVDARKPPRKGTVKREIWDQNRKDYYAGFAKDPHGRLEPGDRVAGPSGTSTVVRKRTGESTVNELSDKTLSSYKDKAVASIVPTIVKGGNIAKAAKHSKGSTLAKTKLEKLASMRSTLDKLQGAVKEARAKMGGEKIEEDTPIDQLVANASPTGSQVTTAQPSAGATQPAKPASNTEASKPSTTAPTAPAAPINPDAAKATANVVKAVADNPNIVSNPAAKKAIGDILGVQSK